MAGSKGSIVSRVPEGLLVELFATPVSPSVEAFVLGAGLTVEGILQAVRWKRPLARTRAFSGGQPLPVEEWNRPLARGQELVLVGIPTEPGTGAAILAFFKALADAAVATATFGTVGGAYAGAAATGAFGVAGATGAAIGTVVGGAALAYGSTALLGSLVRPPDQNLGKSDGGDVSPTLQDTGNQVRPNAPYPYVAGDFRLVPPICFPHSFVRGGESVFLALFIVGLGEHSFSASDVLVGDIPITNFDRAQIVVRQGALSEPGLSLFTRKIVQISLNSVFDPVQFDDDTLRSAWVQFQIPGEGHTRLGVDFNFTQGVSRISDSGRTQIYAFGLQIEFRKNGGSWQNAIVLPSFTNVDAGTNTRFAGNPRLDIFQGLSILKFSGQNSRPFQVGFTWDVSGDGDDMWDIRIRRVEVLPAGLLLGSGGSKAVFGQVVWFAGKGFKFDDAPLQSAGVATIELQVPLDEQFSGLSQNISVRAKRKCRIYDPAASGGADADGWSNLKFVTSNCAAIIRDILQGENNREPVPTSALNVTALTGFYEFCRDFNDGGTGALEFNHVFDARSDVFSCCQAVAAAGRGRFGQGSDGRFTVVWDAPVSGPERYMINAANCRGFRISNVFTKEVNAIRAQFVDSESGFDPNGEKVVYRDGYNKDNIEEEQIETRAYIGSTKFSKVFARARYDLADQTLRPRQVEVEMHLEQLGIPVGALVRFSHPGMFVGESWGRIKRSTPTVFRDRLNRGQNAYSGASRTLSNLTAAWGNAEGGASLITTAAALARVDQVLAAQQSWLGCEFSIKVSIPDNARVSGSDGVRIRIEGPTAADYKEWAFGSSSGLSAGVPATIGAALSSGATSTGGTFNASLVSGWSLRINAVSSASNEMWSAFNFKVERTDGMIVEVVLDQLVRMTASTQYAVEYRTVDAGLAVNEVMRKDVRSLEEFGLIGDSLVSEVYLKTPITAGTTEPDEEQLYSFGPSSTVSIRAVVRNKVAGSEYTARLVLVDEAPGIHTSTGTIPPFVPVTSLLAPLSRLGPATPIIRQIITDERALAVAADGTLRPRILISVAQGIAAGRPRADFWSLRYRRVAPSAFEAVALPRVDANTGQLVIEDVDEGATYDITLQGVSRLGLTSAAIMESVVVVGKTGSPPDVTSFRVEGTNLQWALNDPPADLAGFRIRRTSVGGSFNQAFSVHGDTLVDAPPFSIASLSPGLSSFFIVAEDSSGNQSEVPAELVAFAGLVPEQNVVNTIDIDALGFPIVDQIDSVLEGFEDLIEKETPDTGLDVLYAAEETPLVSSLVGYDATSRLNVERTTVYAGERALSVTDLLVGFPDVILTYVNSINRDKSSLRFRFFGDRATGTWEVYLGLYDKDDPDKSSFWAVYDVATNSQQLIEFDLNDAPGEVGISGAVDTQRIGQLEIFAIHSSPLSGDRMILDAMEWVGGALNGVEVVSGDLKNQASVDQFWSSNPNSAFWSATPSQQFWADISYLDGIYEWTADVEAADLPCDIRIELSDPGVPYQLFYKPIGGSVFVPFPGVLQNAEEATYSFQLRLAGGNIRGSVDQLSVILDVADERETIKEFSVSSTGTVRIPITKTYREIRTVIGAPQGSGVALYQVLDKDATLGPSVIATDTAGSRITKTIDWFVEGVKG